MPLKSVIRFLYVSLTGLLISCSSAEQMADAPVNLSVNDTELTADEILVLGDFLVTQRRKLLNIRLLPTTWKAI